MANTHGTRSSAARGSTPARNVVKPDRGAQIQKRDRDQERETLREDAKRLRSALNDVADEFVCPLTLELPLDPVMAGDGNVYERSAIERYISNGGGGGLGDELKSPVTKERMGPRLLPARQARNSIEKLVRSGAIGGDRAEQWLERVRYERRVAALRDRAQAGDAAAMGLLGYYYLMGEKGLPKDSKRAFYWLKKSSDEGNTKGMAAAGWMLVCGRGVEENRQYGLLLLGRAAQMGSKSAAYNLGVWHSKGIRGLPKDAAQANFWLQKAMTENVKLEMRA